MPRGARSAVLVFASVALLSLVLASVGSDAPCTEPAHAIVPTVSPASIDNGLRSHA